MELVMNMCDLSKFLDISDKMDCYQFDPIKEIAVISKGNRKVTIDLNAEESVQIVEFQTWLDTLGST